MGLLDKSGIQDGQRIDGVHVSNIYDALNETGSFDIQATGSFTGSFTGIFNGTATVTHALTASFAISASHEIFKEISSSNADTASYAGQLYGSPDIAVSNITSSGTVNIGPTTVATGLSAFAQGSGSKATGDYSNAHGRGARATGFAAHAEGLTSIAEGSYSHAEGRLTLASGSYSHTQGHLTTASGDYSHAGGHGTIAAGNYQLVGGNFNISSSNNAAFIIGNGADTNNRSNIIFAGNEKIELNAAVTASGNISGSSTSNLTIGGTVTATSGSFTELSGNSPLTINGNTTFTDHIDMADTKGLRGARIQNTASTNITHVIDTAAIQTITATGVLSTLSYTASAVAAGTLVATSASPGTVAPSSTYRILTDGKVSASGGYFFPQGQSITAAGTNNLQFFSKPEVNGLFVFTIPEAASASIVPDTTAGGDLGSDTKQWRTAWVNSVSASKDISTLGNISASGYVSASSFAGDGAGLTNVPINSPTGTVSGSTQLIELGAAITGSDVIFAHITASGNISSSGNFIGELTGIGGAVTGINSILATDLVLGEDAETKIDFEDANKINFYANNAKEVELAENSLSPGTSDGTALGTTSLQWSDLFLAEGGVINFDNGDVTITQTGNALAIAGTDGTSFAGHITASGKIKGDGSAIENLQRPITASSIHFSASMDNAGYYFRAGGNVTCSIGLNATQSIDIGVEYEFFQTASTGFLVFVTQSSGIVVNSKSGKSKLAGQFSGATLKKVGTNEWDLIGDLG